MDLRLSRLGRFPVALALLACSGEAGPPVSRTTPAAAAPPAEAVASAVPGPASFELAAWSMAAFDAGEPPSFWLPIPRARVADVRNGFGWLSVDGHLVWLNHRERERAGPFGPPISLAVTAEELCSEPVQALLRDWDGEPYAIELLHDWTPDELRCLAGHRPSFLQTSPNLGQSHCDHLVREELLPATLRGLAASGCSVESVRALGARSQLSQLWLADVDADAIRAIAELRSVRSLWLELSDARRAHLLVPLAALPIERLTITGEYTPTEADLAALARMPALTDLTALTPSPASGWPIPARLRSLHVLSIDAAVMRRACASEALRELRVGIAEEIDDDAIACLRGRTSLEALVLGAAAIGPRGLDVIGTLTGLRELDLRGAAVSNLRPLGSLRALRCLTLDGTRVSDDALSLVGRIPELRRLSIRRTQVQHLDALAPLTHLRTLDASMTPVGDDSLGVLRSLSTLGELGLHQTEVSEAAMARFNAARPDVLTWGPSAARRPTR